MMSHGYALFTRPNAWLRDKPMTVRLVYDAVASLVDMGNGGIVEISLARLQQMTQRARRTVLRAVKRLTRAGLLHDLRTRVGRGAVYVFKVAAFYANPKWTKKGKAIQLGSGVVGNSDVSFPQKKVPPVLPIGPRNDQNQKSLKTSMDGRLSPGRVMGLARKHLNQHPRLSQTERGAMLSALGRMVFKLGYLAELRQTPEILGDILQAIDHPTPLGDAVPHDTHRKAFARAMALFCAVIAKQTGRMTQQRLDHLACPQAAGYSWSPSKRRTQPKPERAAAPEPVRSERVPERMDARAFERVNDLRRRQYSAEGALPDYATIGQEACTRKHENDTNVVYAGISEQIQPQLTKNKAGSTGRALSSPTRDRLRAVSHRFHNMGVVQ